MSGRTINLDEIIEKITGEEIGLTHSRHVLETRACMTEAIRQALEIAAREAALEINTGKSPRVDRQSILNVIERVK